MVLLLLIQFCIIGSLAGEQKKNVLFIAVDDLKPLLGCYESAWVKSPNIDAIAKSGTTFLNNHCQWAVCGPSRASLMLGMRPESTKVMDLKTNMREARPDVRSLPQVFKENGYTTVARGKIYDPRCVPGGRSDDDPQSWSLPYEVVNSGPKHTKDVVSAPDVGPDEITDGFILQQGLKALDEVLKSDKPFFLAVGFKKPHLPFEAPKSYWNMYDREKLPLSPYPERAKGNHAKYSYHDSKEPRTYKGTPKKGDFDIALQREMIHGYAACVSYVDDLIGRLVQALKDKGQYDNTIICILGDHGFHLGDHNMWGKHSNLEQATRSPLIIRAPGLPAEQRCVAPSEFIDIFPTLLDLCGLPPEQSAQGKSLKPMLMDEKVSVKNGAISNFKQAGALGYAYRTERYRYVEWISQKSKELVCQELYDYQTDPGESKNLATLPENSELVAQLAKNLREEAQGSKLIFGKKSK